MRSTRKKLSSQPRLKGIRRIPRVGTLHPDVEADLERLSKQYRVSRSWIIAFALDCFLYGGDAKSTEDFRD